MRILKCLRCKKRWRPEELEEDEDGIKYCPNCKGTKLVLRSK